MTRTITGGAIAIFALCAAPVLASEKAPVSVSDLAQLRDIGGGAHLADISVSPDGKWLAFQLQEPDLDNNTFKTTWMAAPADGKKKPRIIADGGEVILDPQFELPINGARPAVRAKWSPDSASFAYVVSRDGRRQIWISRPERRGQQQLTQNAGHVTDFFWSQDGDKLYFETTRDPDAVRLELEAEGERGFLVDDRTRVLRGARPDQQFCSRTLNSPEFKSLMRSCEPALWVYDLRSRKERRINEDEAKALTGGRRLALFGTLGDAPPETPAAIEGRDVRHLKKPLDRDRYAWLENRDPETYVGFPTPVTLHALLESGEIRSCAETACQMWDLSHFPWVSWDEDGEEILFTHREGHARSRTALYAWNPDTQRLRTILQTEDHLEGCKRAGDRLVCLHESWTTPRKIVSVALDSGRLKTLYDPNPNFAARAYPRIEKLEWKDVFGLETYGHLVYPVDYDPGRSYPMVIVTYRSRGFLRGGVGNEYPIYPFAAAGFFVLSHDMPGDLYGMAKSADPTGYLRKDFYLQRAALSSQEAIVAKLVERGLVDKRRVAITGLSQGAMQTVHGLINSDAFAAGVASSSSHNATSYYLMSGKQRQSFGAWLEGDPDEPGSHWNRYSAGYNADKVDEPLLINVADDELLIGIEDYVRLKDAGKPFEMYVFPDEHHIKWRPLHRLNIYRRNIQWLKFWLKGEEESDPVSPGQYARWRRMRDDHCAKLKAQGKNSPVYCAF